ncbi:uncharacterized protein LOC142663513 isoform X2 [Rhinoderma darwinii]|uniref:uncharacterized protein LOC142663513 isoform X2 n=1 Tax=Rhinoderma darwinii TaxID=43563 RepID=UPI003F67B3F8
MMEDHRDRTSPGKRDLYKDVMMENHTPPDGSSKTCPSGYPEENGRVPQHHQIEGLLDIKVEAIDEEEEKYMRVDQQYGLRKENPPDKCPAPLYSQENDNVLQDHGGEDLTNVKLEVKSEEDEAYVRGDQPCKEEEIPRDIGTDGSSQRNPPERFAGPLYSQDCPEENDDVPQDHQGEDLTTVKLEVKSEDETCIWSDQPCKEEEIPKDVGTVANAKSRWSTCPDQFQREMVSKGHSGEGQMKKRPYIYTQQLPFLKAVMDIVPTSDNLREVNSDATLVESPSGTKNPPLEESTPVLEDRTSPPPPRRRRNRKRQEGYRLSSIDAHVLAHLQQRAEDSLENVFGKTVAQHLKRMPSERQLRCQSAILGVLDTFMNNPAPMELCNAIEFHRNRHVMPLSPITTPTPPPPCASAYRGYVPSQPQLSQDRPTFSAPGQFPGGQYTYQQVQGGELQVANVAGPSTEDFVSL